MTLGTRDYLANSIPVPSGTVPQLLLEAVDRFGAKTAFRAIKDEGFHEISYHDVQDTVRAIGGGLYTMGVVPGDRVAVLSENRPEWSLTDFGAICAGVPMVPIHTTLTPLQIAYILRDSGAKAVFASNQEMAEKAEQAFQTLDESPRLVVFDSEGELPPEAVNWVDFLQEGRAKAGKETLESFRERALSLGSEEAATIIYTSGTTGDPKGVVLTHNNLFSNAKSLSTAIHVDETDTTLSFLPLSHILQRMVDLVFFSKGAAITYGRSVKTIPEDLILSKPTKVVGAPRVFEKIYQAVMDQRGIKGMIVRWAREVGEAWAEETLSGRKPTLVLRMVYGVADRLVFKKIRVAMGGELVFFVSGGAPLAGHINKFFFSAGILILEAYGLTETSPGITINTPEDFRIGTVGPPIPGTEIKIAEDGEVIVRGPQVMKGYFNRPDETAEALDSAGWLKTGDIGHISKDGHLCLTDRKKNLLVTAGGKNVAPAPIEDLVKGNRYVDQVVMIGDQRHFPALLVVPAFEPLDDWARSAGMTPDNRSDLLRESRVQDHLGQEVFSLLGDLATYERPKKIGLIQEEFTIEGGTLTPSQKVKRRVVNDRYGSLIDRFYDPANRDISVFTEED